MLRLKDLFLLLVSYSTMALGVYLPKAHLYMAHVPIIGLVLLLFLAFLPIRVLAILQLFIESPMRLSLFLLTKIVLMPVAVYTVFSIFLPEYALGALLISGMSTAVAAPFISNLLQADTRIVIVQVVLSSLLLPLTLPVLVKFLASREMQISLWPMISMLGLVVIIPATASALINSWSPKLTERLYSLQYPFSVAIIGITNICVFSRYSSFFHQNMDKVAECSAIVFLLATLYFIAGILVSSGSALRERLACVISMSAVNFILCMVFCSTFFGPLEATMAALYSLPIFLIIIPLRLYASRSVS